MAMQYSRNGMIFTACREAIVTEAYQDGAHCSIAMGSNDPSLKPGDTITIKEAFVRFRRDIAARDTIVNRSLKVDVSQQQYDSIFDLYYQNANKLDVDGRPGFKTMVGLINASKFDEAFDYFPKCCLNSKGEKISGLLGRRHMEQAIWKDGDYSDLTKIPFYRGNPHIVPRETYVLQPGDLD